MRVLLVRTTDGRFLETEAEWTIHARQAKDFGSTTTAIAFARTHKLDDADIILDFPDAPEHNVRLHLALHAASSAPHHD